ncbi:MAG TPA: helix-turn-helix transcriptional regulator [Candidatus Limnocylindrales bacterium]
MRFDSNKYRRPTPRNQQLGLDLLGDALYAARVERFSQRELAFRAGVSQSTISRLERGLAPGVSVRRLRADPGARRDHDRPATTARRLNGRRAANDRADTPTPR